MATSTYLDLTNRLLRRLNEVELTSGTFASAVGIQATCKDAILDTINEINNSRIDWPFNAVEHSQNLDIGVEEYAWPEQFTSADWNSFQLQSDDTLNTKNTLLKAITREEWYEYLRDTDYDSGTDGISIPLYVFPSHGQGFGVSPSPKEEYPIKYRYYKSPADLSAYDDEVTIPSRFNYVIMSGALYHMNLFKENPQGNQIAEMKYKQGVNDMINAYLPNPNYVYSGMVKHSSPSSGFYWFRGGI